MFDDPVSSLDYRRLEYVAKRLVELSATRQVIVFSHNIWFATALLEHVADVDRCAYYDVTEGETTKGVISSGSHPRWDVVKKTKGKINRLIQEAKSAPTQETREAFIFSAYGAIRNITETIVEQELLQNVCQRYSPHVAMTKLDKIRVDRLKAAFDAIVPVYERACRVIVAHSQPLETLNVRTTLEELEGDWKSLLAARDAYIG